MAKSIDPFPKKKSTTQELLQRVTSPAAASPIKPKAPAVVSTKGPLPVGKVFTQEMPTDSKDLTPIERDTLRAVGWNENEPIPSNMAEILEQVTKTKLTEASQVAPPVDPRTAPLKVDVKDIGSLSASEQASIRAAMADALATQQRIKDEAASAKQQPAIPGLAPAIAAAEQAVRASQEEVINDLTPKTDKAQVNVPSETPKSDIPDTGIAGALTHCPHCDWDLSQPVDIEPAYAEKMSFLHALLGQKPYSYETTLFGGRITVRFRTLTLRELEVAYRQVANDRAAGKLPGVYDSLEQMSRYRLALQLQVYRDNDVGGFVHDFPDGYSKSTNKAATGVWVTEEQEHELGLDKTGLPEILEYVQSFTLASEAVFRILNREFAKFNRLIAKLEVMADNADFWKPIEAQS